MRATRLAPLLLFIASPALAVSKAELEARIQRLEAKLNRVVLEQHDEIQRLRSELQEFRGEIEVQSHELQVLQKKQRELYLDIDRRLGSLESGGSATPPGYGTGAGQSGGTPPGAGASGAADEVDEAGAREDYDRALAILKQGRYDQALVAFRQFLKQHPGSSYADNAQYWVGEVHYVRRRFPEALEEFETVLKRFPDSPKVADARLKIGFINYELKQWDAARSALERVVSDYPGSTPARLANERLQRMRKEGR